MEHRCNTCDALQGPSYEEVARGFTLPSLADYCPCKSRGRLDTQTVRDGDAGANPGMIALMGIHAGKSAFRILMALVMHSLYGIWNICSVSLERT